MTVEYCEALFVENAADPKWDAPKAAEMKSMQDFDVWELVPRPKNTKVIRSKWVSQEKPGKLKARLVAIGCEEKGYPSLLFSLVVNMVTVKALLSLVVQKGLALRQMDVSNAYIFTVN